jgi:hypothetical protein
MSFDKTAPGGVVGVQAGVELATTPRFSTSKLVRQTTIVALILFFNESPGFLVILNVAS